MAVRQLGRNSGGSGRGTAEPAVLHVRNTDGPPRHGEYLAIFVWFDLVLKRARRMRHRCDCCRRRLQ